MFNRYPNLTTDKTRLAADRDSEKLGEFFLYLLESSKDPVSLIEELITLIVARQDKYLKDETVRSNNARPLTFSDVFTYRPLSLLLFTSAKEATIEALNRIIQTSPSGIQRQVAQLIKEEFAEYEHEAKEGLLSGIIPSPRFINLLDEETSSMRFHLALAGDYVIAVRNNLIEVFDLLHKEGLYIKRTAFFEVDKNKEITALAAQSHQNGIRIVYATKEEGIWHIDYEPINHTIHVINQKPILVGAVISSLALGPALDPIAFIDDTTQYLKVLHAELEEARSFQSIRSVALSRLIGQEIPMNLMFDPIMGNKIILTPKRLGFKKGDQVIRRHVGIGIAEHLWSTRSDPMERSSYETMPVFTSSLFVHPEKDIIVAGYPDGSIKRFSRILWGNDREIGDVALPTDARISVRDIKMNTDGKIIVAIFEDGTIKTYNYRSRKIVVDIREKQKR